MEIFHVISVAVPIIIALGLPHLLAHKEASARKNLLVLYAACAVFFVSWYLPSPLIDGQDTSFVTHFIGGGIFCALLWFYVKRSLSLRVAWWLECLLVFALVSSLGSINELAEFFMVKTGIASILLVDTTWDIVANTLGAAIGLMLGRLARL